MTNRKVMLKCLRVANEWWMEFLKQDESKDFDKANHIYHSYMSVVAEIQLSLMKLGLDENRARELALFGRGKLQEFYSKKK